jgi:protein-tyrosine phosphatase
MLGRFDNRPSQVQRATAALQKALRRAGIPLLLSPGMEYLLDEYFPVLLEQPQTLGDSRLLLVEVPRQVSIELVLENVRLIIQRGLIPLLAHPERSDFLHMDASFQQCRSLIGLIRRWLVRRGDPVAADDSLPASLVQDQLQDVGCLLQGNLLSFSGCYGRPVQQRVLANLEQGFYYCFGSDGHGAESLAAGLLPALQALTNHPQGMETLKGSV